MNKTNLIQYQSIDGITQLVTNKATGCHDNNHSGFVVKQIGVDNEKFKREFTRNKKVADNVLQGVVKKHGGGYKNTTQTEVSKQIKIKH